MNMKTRIIALVLLATAAFAVTGATRAPAVPAADTAADSCGECCGGCCGSR